MKPLRYWTNTTTLRKRLRRQGRRLNYYSHWRRHLWIKDMCMPSPSRNGLERSTPPTRILVPEWTRIGVDLRKHLEFRYVTYVMVMVMYIVNLLETYHTNYIL